MATVNFLYRSTKDNSTLTARFLFRHNTKDFVFSSKTKIEVSKTYWKQDHNKKSRDAQVIYKQAEINQELSRLENYILKNFNNTDISEVNKEWFKTLIEHYYTPPKTEKKVSDEVLEYFNYFIEKKQSEVVERTIKNYKVVLKQLERYQATKSKKILIKDIDYNFSQDFEKFCEQNNYSPNTIAKGLRTIKTVCKHAEFNGIETHRQLNSIKIKSHKIEKIWLNLSELEAIENLSQTELSESLENARDWLIISCYTGQRISDFMNFNKGQIRIEENKYLLEFTQKKTGKNMTIPVHEKVLGILKKRNGDFPRAISDQRYNDYIKVVCKIAGIDTLTNGSIMKEVKNKQYRKENGIYPKHELVTSHIGRRSFATNYYGKIPTTFLIYVTGHSTESMFLNYIGKSNKDLAIELTKYF